MRGLWIQKPDERVLRLRHHSPGRRLQLRSLPKRYRPVTINAKRDSSRLFEVHYPRGWRLVGGPRSASFRNLFGSYEVTVSRGPGRIVIRQRMIFNRVRRPPHYALKLQRLQMNATQLSGINLTFRTGGGLAPGVVAPR